MKVPDDPLITGVILAGGRGRRMGAQDKGLIELAGGTLVERLAGLLSPQVDEVLINANRNLAGYARTGYPVHTDVLPGFHGPLAGMLTGLVHAAHDLVAFVPCDAPALPAGLVQRLVGGMRRAGSPGAYAHDGERACPVYAVLRRDCIDTLRGCLAEGRLRVGAALREAGLTAVDFSDSHDAFFNINAPADLAAWTTGRHAHTSRPAIRIP